MSLTYRIGISNPSSHYLEVKIIGSSDQASLCFFMPVWSPGSYLVREYSRHVSKMRLVDSKGVILPLEQVAKNKWSVSNFSGGEFELSYRVYCHETSVRTSFIDESHAFLHGPSIFFGLENDEMKDLELHVDFPKIWTKISTGLKDISPKRDEFKYFAKDFDELLDCPLEMGCQDTDGFMFKGKEHEMSFYGPSLKHKHDFKKDFETIVEHVSSYFEGELPYDRYVFMTHFLPNVYGGLEHSNSTALQFDGSVLNNRKDYVNFLSLVAHEYFHTWNVKRIRPRELGPFNYNEENYTPMLWLAEGLTSLMDDLMILRCGLCTQKEYLEIITRNLNLYHSMPGRYMDSLEMSSYNAWVKLYRPDANSRNSSISYYLKGGLVFMALMFKLHAKNKSINSVISGLWDFYQERPELGMNSSEFYELIEKVSDSETREYFEKLVQTTEDIDFETLFKEAGFELEYEAEKKLSLGVISENKQNNLFIKTVYSDGAAYKSGLNAGDEIVFINGMRASAKLFKDFEAGLIENTEYELIVSRRNVLTKVFVTAEFERAKIKEIKVVDEKRASALLLN